MRFLLAVALVVPMLMPAAAAAADGAKIAFGPMLGRLSPTGIGVWARTERPGKFFVLYGTEPGRLDRSAGPAETALAGDCTGWIHVTDLEPDTKYYYTVVPDAPRLAGNKPDPNRSGSFRTLPDAARLRDPDVNPKGLFNFEFEFACGNNQTPGQGAGSGVPAFKTMLGMLEDRISFAIQNGDWLYEAERDYQPSQWLTQVGATEDQLPHELRVAPTMVGVWENYKKYLRDAKPLAAWHRRVPTFFTFDDHEILNDVWGCGTPGLRDRRAVYRDVGVKAWYDYLGWSNPVDFRQPIYFGRGKLEAGQKVLVDDKADFSALDPGEAATLLVQWGTETDGVNENALDGVGGDPNAGVYSIAKVLGKHRLEISPPPKASGEVSYTIGRRSYYRFRVANCEFFVLDTRTHREMHDTQHPDKPGLSMLGARQKKWLLDGMRQSDADFLFVVSSVNFMVPHVGGGKVRAENKDDAWTVFLDEREQLILAWDKLGKPVSVLTGDLHNSFVIKITDNVWEFASGPHNSNNHWNTDEGDRPASGKFQYGPRACDIRWSTLFRSDIPRDQLTHPTFCVIQVNNVFNNPKKLGGTRWVAFERPQVIFKYYDGRSGELRYAESRVAQ